MKDIIEDKELLFEVYKDRFGFPPSENENLRKEFNKIMLRKVDYMPYWFVCELIGRGYNINESEEDDLF